MQSFTDIKEWEAWLGDHHDDAGIWIRFATVASGIPTVTHDEALDVALCYGWIDGQVRRIDPEHFAQRFTPRTRRSRWSQVNCAKAEQLIAAGRMQPPGQQQIESAKADGRWDAAYEPPSRSNVPEDLAAAFAQNPQAQAFFEALDSRNRYAVLYRIREAKRTETRARRIEKFVGMLARGEKLHP